MENYKLLDSSEEIPLGYRLLTVEEALEHSKEVTKFLANDIVGSQTFENLQETIDGFESKTIIEVFNHQAAMDSQSEASDDNSQQKVENSLQNTTSRFLVYREDGRKRVIVLEVEFNKEENIEENPNIGDFTLVEKLLQKGKENITYSLDRDNVFKQNGTLKLNFIEVDMRNEDDDDDDDDDSESDREISKSSLNKDDDDDDDDDDNDDDDKEIPMGYRLATVEELLLSLRSGIQFLVKKTTFEQYDIWLILRRLDILREGENKDIQDFFGTYFKYEANPNHVHWKIRLKNGFIDKNRRLVWRKFTKHYIDQQLAVRCGCKGDENKATLEDQVVALLFACFLKSYEEISDIIKEPNVFEIVTKNNDNAPREGSVLHLCAEEGMTKILKLIMDKIKDPKEALTKKADWDEETPLYMAVLRGHARMVKRLCMRENVNEGTKEYKHTALMMAAKYQMEDTKLWRPIVKCKGLKLSQGDRRGNTVFHLVSHYGGAGFYEDSRATLLKELLEKCGCKVSYKAYEAAGVGALEQDVIEEVAALYRENVKHTCDPNNDSHFINLTNDRNGTPLHVSLEFNESTFQPTPIQFSRLLISAGADIHAIGMLGQNALHRACKFPDDRCTIKILFHCFFGNTSNKASRSFHDAKIAWSKYTCTRDFFGQTPLHLAAKSGNNEAVHLLLDSTYNIFIDKLIQMRDYNDKTIFHFIATRHDPSAKDDDIKVEMAEFICTQNVSRRALALLIWSVAEKIGLADEWAAVSEYGSLTNMLRTKRKKITENLLGLALCLENYDMVVELINRGAIVTKQMQHDAQSEDLLNQERKFWDDKIQHVKDEKHMDIENNHTCAKRGRSCLIPFYEARKKQVDERIKILKMKKNQPSLRQLKVLEQIQESHRGRTTDQPTSEDLLERQDIKSSISALLLNQHMGSPITLGILGGTGMGKSSMMLQVEHNLLSKAARETLSLALPTSSGKQQERNIFTGAKVESAISKKRAEKLLNQLKSVIQKIKHKRKSYDSIEEAIDLQNVKESESLRNSKGWKHYIFEGLTKLKYLLVSTFEHKILSKRTIVSKIDDFISNCGEEHMWIIKRLALANDGQEVPTLLTVRYNAWQYETRDEAWAGLAVAILKEMESCMTKAQLFYASVMYSYKRSPSNARVQLLIPIILYLLIGGIVGWVSFTLLSIPKSPLFASFRYGSIPICVLASIWQVLSQVATYAKPISEKFMESTKSLQVQHLLKVGYQHQVIEDINFLRDHMTSKNIPLLCLWILGAFIFNISSGSTLLANQIEASDTLKYTPRRENFRIIVFIDNLDRHKEKLFTPLNMILKSCDINAVVAIDKGSVEDVIEKAEEEPAGVEKEQEKTSLIKDTLLQQLIQIPIVLPEPDVYELRNSFLKEHLKDKRKKPNVQPSSVNPMDSNQQAPSNTHQGSSSISQDATDSIKRQDNEDDQNSYNTLTRANTLAIGTSELRIEEKEPPASPHEVTCHSMDISLPKYLKHDQEITEIIEMTMQPTENLEDNTLETREDQMHNTSQENYKENAWLEMKVNVLDSNYTRGEIKTFKHLVSHTYGYYRSPRAWKSLLNYHRLIRSLITYNYQYLDISAWKPQLIIWIFFCWQWREQMNEIFENWESLTSFPLRELKYNNLLVSNQHKRDLKKILKSESQSSLLKEKQYTCLWDSINGIYPSLLRIIEEKRTKNQLPSSGEVGVRKAKEESILDSSSPKLAFQKKPREDEDDDIHWKRISKVLILGKHDVTMQAIQTFQKYRFDCEASPLKLHTH